MPKSLKDARNEGDLESFIKEHEKDALGDLDKLEKTIRHSDRVPEREVDPADMRLFGRHWIDEDGTRWFEHAETGEVINRSTTDGKRRFHELLRKQWEDYSSEDEESHDKDS